MKTKLDGLLWFHTWNAYLILCTMQECITLEKLSGLNVILLCHLASNYGV